MAVVCQPETAGSSDSEKAAGTVRLSVQQQALAEEIGERVRARLDTRSGLITITAKCPMRRGGTVAQLAMTYLTQYVTNYRTEKARQDLAFYGQQLAGPANGTRKRSLPFFSTMITTKML